MCHDYLEMTLTLLFSIIIITTIIITVITSRLHYAY